MLLERPVDDCVMHVAHRGYPRCLPVSNKPPRRSVGQHRGPQLLLVPMLLMQLHSMHVLHRPLLVGLTMWVVSGCLYTKHYQKNSKKRFSSSPSALNGLAHTPFVQTSPPGILLGRRQIVMAF